MHILFTIYTTCITSVPTVWCILCGSCVLLTSVNQSRWPWTVKLNLDGPGRLILSIRAVPLKIFSHYFFNPDLYDQSFSKFSASFSQQIIQLLVIPCILHVHCYSGKMCWKLWKHILVLYSACNDHWCLSPLFSHMLTSENKILQGHMERNYMYISSGMSTDNM